MTRVLLIEPCFENYGGYYRAFGMARGLALRGFDVTLLISARGRWVPRCEKTAVSANLRVVKLPRLQLNPWINGRLLRAFIGLFMAVFGRYDIVHVFTVVQFETLVPFLFLRLFMPWKKVVLDWDDYWTEVHTQHPSPNLFEHPAVRWYMRFCEYRVQRLARHGTVTSEYLKDEFAGLGVTHTVKIINGVDTAQCEAMDRAAARRELGIAPDETVFLSFGNSFHKERTVWLFQLFDMILAHAPEARLHLNIAPDELWGKYGGGVSLRPGTMERIRHVGYLSGRALSLQLGACDAVIFMMSDSKPDVACFPTRVGTFLNGGRFIIMNRNGSEAMRTLLELGCVVTADSLPELARRAVEVMADAPERARLEAAALSARSALSWEQLGAPLAEFYRESLAHAR